jgi:hypothetical protein
MKDNAEQPERENEGYDLDTGEQTIEKAESEAEKALSLVLLSLLLLFNSLTSHIECRPTQSS